MKLFLPALLLAVAPALAQPYAPAPAQAPVSVTLTMQNPSALEVSYQLPPSCPALVFRNTDMRPETVADLRSDWKAADDCTVFDGHQIKPARAECTVLRLRVPASKREFDRIYPSAYPIEGGLYVHTGAYAVTDVCGLAEWKFDVPGGTVVVDGKTAANSDMRAAGNGGDWMPAVLLQQAYHGGVTDRIRADSRFSLQTRAVIESTAYEAEQQLRKDLPGIKFTMPFIVAAVAAPGYWHGDVANRTVMRLAFQPEPGPAQADALHSFITHETSHVPQAVDWNDTWGEDQSLIAEGGAELLRVAVASQLGWYDHGRTRAELEHAFNGCAVAAAGKNWKSIHNRGWGKVPYDCGLAFHLLALSSNPGAKAPLLRLRDYYLHARAGERTDFAQMLECGNKGGCDPYWLKRLAGNEPLDNVLLDYTRQPDALLHVATKWDQGMVTALVRRHVAALMRADCKGAVSIFFHQETARIGDGARCATLRPDMVVVSAEGLPLFRDGAALQASARACRETGKTSLGVTDGSSVSLACDNSVGLPPHIYSVDAGRALDVLRAPN